VFKDTPPPTPRYRLRLVSLGGGPGFELLAAQWFLRYWACVGGRPLAEREAWLQGGSFEAAELAAHAEEAAAAAAAAAAVAVAGGGGGREAAAEAAELGEEAAAARLRAGEVSAMGEGNRPPAMEFASLDLQVCININIHTHTYI